MALTAPFAKKKLRLEIITLIAVVIVVAIYVRTIKTQSQILKPLTFLSSTGKYGNVDFLAFDWAPGTFNAHHCAKATAA